MPGRHLQPRGSCIGRLRATGRESRNRLRRNNRGRVHPRPSCHGHRRAGAVGCRRAHRSPARRIVWVRPSRVRPHRRPPGSRQRGRQGAGLGHGCHGRRQRRSSRTPTDRPSRSRQRLSHSIPRVGCSRRPVEAGDVVVWRLGHRDGWRGPDCSHEVSLGSHGLLACIREGRVVGLGHREPGSHRHPVVAGLTSRRPRRPRLRRHAGDVGRRRRSPLGRARPGADAGALRRSSSAASTGVVVRRRRAPPRDEVLRHPRVGTRALGRGR